MQIPQQWQALNKEDFCGTVLVVGGSDTGKSTLVRWLVQRLGRDQRVAWLDADPGQSTLGLPTTLNLAIADTTQNPEPRLSCSFFVGATSPKGHMLPLLSGLQRLREKCHAAGAATLIVDTTG